MFACALLRRQLVHRNLPNDSGHHLLNCRPRAKALLSIEFSALVQSSDAGDQSQDYVVQLSGTLLECVLEESEVACRVVAVTADQNLRIAFCLNVRRGAVLWASHLQKKGRSDWKCEWPKLHIEEVACASRAIQVSKHASSTHSDVYYSVDRVISSIFVD